jgi:polar amino acid transport system substrate-binding protein
MRYIVGRPILTVYANAIPDRTRYNRDNVVVVVSFADGSVGNILYLANGDKSLPKEYYEVFCEGAVARLDDYRTLELFRGSKGQSIKCNRDKGHKKEVELTLKAMREGQPSPIVFEELAEVTAASFAVMDALNLGLPVHLSDHRSSPSGCQDEREVAEDLIAWHEKST